MAIGPAIAGMYMQKDQVSVNGVSGSFPSSESYNMVFLKRRMQKLEVFIYNIRLGYSAIV